MWYQRQIVDTYSSHAHGRDRHALVLAAQLRQRGDDLASAGAAQGVAKGTVGISIIVEKEETIETYIAPPRGLTLASSRPNFWTQ